MARDRRLQHPRRTRLVEHPMIPNGPTRATWFLTHRCNIACSYCATILPDQMTPDLDTIRETLAVAAGIVRLEPEVVILTGGEPTMHPHAQWVVDYLNAQRQEFVLITNATRPFKLTGVRNLSASVDVDDPTAWRRVEAVTDEAYKSAHGLAFLADRKADGMDATASVVIGRHNAMAAPALVALMWERHRIPTMLSVLHEAKMLDLHQWRFRSRHAHAALTVAQAMWVSVELVAYAELHPDAILNDVGYLTGIAHHGATLNWHCDTPSDLVVDSDGSVLTCSDWWGEECRALNVTGSDTAGWLDQWQAAHRHDNRRCPGCFWNCAYQAESAASSIRPNQPRSHP
jgi:MoaA/NifB/PqqE/SkfB family radical SAM enzyme